MPREPESESCGSELARDSVRPERGYRSLRFGRWSASGTTYFVTFCTECRRHGLTRTPILSALSQERVALELDGCWRIRAWVVMPDHVHVLFELGLRLPLARVIARFKSKTSRILRGDSMAWQRGYFEHRLRSADELRPTLYYLLMNPVRAGLCERGHEWTGFHCGPEEWSWFKDYAHEAVASPEWLSALEEVASKLAPTASAALRS